MAAMSGLKALEAAAPPPYRGRAPAGPPAPCALAGTAAASTGAVGAGAGGAAGAGGGVACRASRRASSAVTAFWSCCSSSRRRATSSELAGDWACAGRPEAHTRARPIKGTAAMRMADTPRNRRRERLRREAGRPRARRFRTDQRLGGARPGEGTTTCRGDACRPGLSIEPASARRGAVSPAGSAARGAGGWARQAWQWTGDRRWQARSW